MNNLESKEEELAEKIVSLTGFGQALHINDILSDIKELVSQTERNLTEKVKGEIEGHERKFAKNYDAELMQRGYSLAIFEILSLPSLNLEEVKENNG